MEIIFKFSVYMSLAFAIITVIFILVGKEKQVPFFSCGTIFFTIFVVFGALAISESDLNGNYYLEAEKYVQNDLEVVFTTEQGFYKWATKTEMPESCYLLTMSDNNTNDTNDDEIIVVWEAK